MGKVIILVLWMLFCPSAAQAQELLTGAERTGEYIDLLKDKKVGVLCNHTATIGQEHLVDHLLTLGVDVATVFAPEHGFRGDADAGELVGHYTDPRTGIPVFSIYGSNKKPPVSEVGKLDVVLFDIQDVGVRFYTYLSSMHYMMESCAEAGVPLVILDRPNPNGNYVDGPVLQPKNRSFVGMHPIPVVHGMTLGELARMINGEGWLEGGIKCELTVIPCSGYSHRTRYRLPVAPSPNLPNMRAIYLYPSLCFFEGTPVSIGRGTDFPFQVYGHPNMKGYQFTFTPESRPGAKDPPQKGNLCYGVDMRYLPASRALAANGVDMSYVIEAYHNLRMGDKFFTRMFDLLTGADYVREMIVAGRTADEIKAAWTGEVAHFKTLRKRYLLYED